MPAALYVQYLRNAPVDDVMRNVYGRDVSFADALRDEWFRRHLDYLGFVHEAQELLGAGRVKAFLSNDDTVGTFMARYGPVRCRCRRRTRNGGMRPGAHRPSACCAP